MCDCGHADVKSNLQMMTPVVMDMGTDQQASGSGLDKVRSRSGMPCYHASAAAQQHDCLQALSTPRHLSLLMCLCLHSNCPRPFCGVVLTVCRGLCALRPRLC